MSPMSAGGDPAELLAVVEPLDPPLLALGEIEAVGVEEADGHRLRVVGAQADRPSRPGCLWCGCWCRVTGMVANLGGR